MTAAPTFGIAPPSFRLPSKTRLGAVHLQVAELSRSIAYYRDLIGLQLLASQNGVAQLGADHALSVAPADASARPALGKRTLLVLHELRGATPVVARRRFGLFHLAILLPSRAALGQFLVHLAVRQVPAAMSDHAVSEAIYLTDPDGHGLEIYADRPRNVWRDHDGQLAMGTDALDAQSVVAAANGVPWRGVPPGTVIGHVHLHVGRIDEAARFFHNTLGFDQTVWDYPGALFLAAGGYHHHVGTNTWARNAVAPPATEARLLEWTIELPLRADIEELARSCEAQRVPYLWEADSLLTHDPWGTAVRISLSISP